MEVRHTFTLQEKSRQWVRCRCGRRFLLVNLDNHRLQCIGDIVRVYLTGEEKK